jgi:hypothetical protein
MPPSAQIEETTLPTLSEQNGSTPAAANGPASMSTLPQAGHNWQITLGGKVIASKLISTVNASEVLN